jgi:hypothetical protein
MRASRLTPTDVFGVPTEVSELAISASVGDPTLSPDQLVIAFTSGLTGPENDIYYATRTSPAQSFGAPLPVTDVSLPNVDEHDVELAHDGCELYFRSDRGGASRLYVATAQ